ncbi:MAG: OB-fold nucleic acid binding domain-containing protein, partial [Rhizobiaceae bacterium]
PNGRRVDVAGLVLVRQRPGSAKGVIFMTLEDEGGVANVIIWPKTFERFRAVVLGSRLVRVSGRLQSEAGVIHIVAESIADISPWLSGLTGEAPIREGLANADEVRRPVVEHRFRPARSVRRTLQGALHQPPLSPAMPPLQRDPPRLAEVMPKGRNFH